jgi:integrase/recombinase XerD
MGNIVLDVRQNIPLFLDFLTIECGLADNTILAYRRDLTKFSDYSETRRIDVRTLTPTQLQGFLVQLDEDGLALSSIARHYAAVRMFLRYLYLEKKVDRDITTIVESPKKSKPLPKVMHYSQVEALLDAPDPADPPYLRDKAILETLYATGMRVSELVGLKTDSMNLKVGYVRVFGKGNKERIIPVGRVAIDAVEKYQTILRPAMTGPKSDDGLFLSRTGRPLDRTMCWRIVKKYARRAGLHDSVTPHTLRHSFATQLLAGGADLRMVQEMLGHVDVTTTQIYTHVDRSHLQKAHAQFHPFQQPEFAES